MSATDIVSIAGPAASLAVAIVVPEIMYWKQRKIRRAREAVRTSFPRPATAATGPLPVEIPNWPPTIDPPSSDPFWDSVVGVDVNDWIAAKTPESFAELLRLRAAKPARKGRPVSAAQQRWREFLAANPQAGEPRETTEIYTWDQAKPVRTIEHGTIPELDWLLNRKDVR